MTIIQYIDTLGLGVRLKLEVLAVPYDIHCATNASAN